jgi:hypothetical protein
MMLETKPLHMAGVFDFGSSRLEQNGALKSGTLQLVLRLENPALQTFKKANKPFGYSKTKRLMRQNARLVVQPRVTAKLAQTTVSSPGFGGLHERTAHTRTSGVFFHEPALEKSHG